MRSWPGAAVLGGMALLRLEQLDPLAVARIAADPAPPRRSAQTLDQQRIAIRDPGRDRRERGVDVTEREVAERHGMGVGPFAARVFEDPLRPLRLATLREQIHVRLGGQMTGELPRLCYQRARFVESP